MNDIFEEFQSEIQLKLNIPSTNDIPKNTYSCLKNIDVDEYTINNEKFYIDKKDKNVYKMIDSKINLLIGKKIGILSNKTIILD